MATLKLWKSLLVVFILNLINCKISQATSSDGPAGWEDVFAKNNTSILPLYHYGGKSYYMGIHFKANYLQAHLFCQSINMNLLSIKSSEENDRIYKYVRDANQGIEYWTAGSRLVDGNHWLWMANGELVEYTNWADRKPSTKHAHCLSLWLQKNKGLYWQDRDCNALLWFICERPSSGNYNQLQYSSLSGWTNMFQNAALSANINLLHFGNKSYYVSRHLKAKYLQAIQFCKMINMQLVTITSDDENSRLHKYIRDTFAGSLFWSSGARFLDGKSWTWLSTGQYVEYTNWAPHKPNTKYHHCIRLVDQRNTGLFWDDMNCEYQSSFICEYPSVATYNSYNYFYSGNSNNNYNGSTTYYTNYGNNGQAVSGFENIDNSGSSGNNENGYQINYNNRNNNGQGLSGSGNTGNGGPIKNEGTNYNSNNRQGPNGAGNIASGDHINNEDNTQKSNKQGSSGIANIPNGGNINNEVSNQNNNNNRPGSSGVANVPSSGNINNENNNDNNNNNGQGPVAVANIASGDNIKNEDNNGNKNNNRQRPPGSGNNANGGIINNENSDSNTRFSNGNDSPQELSGFGNIENGGSNNNQTGEKLEIISEGGALLKKSYQEQLGTVSKIGTLQSKSYESFSSSSSSSSSGTSSSTDSEWTNFLKTTSPGSVEITQIDGRKYHLERDTDATHSEALEFCRYHEMQLVEVLSKEKNNAIERLVSDSMVNGPYWTSGIKLSNGSWSWSSTAQPMKYTNWNLGSPADGINDQTCIEIDELGKWNDQVCDQKRYFICEATQTSETAQGNTQCSTQPIVNVYIINKFSTDEDQAITNDNLVSSQHLSETGEGGYFVEVTNNIDATSRQCASNMKGSALDAF